MPRKPKTPPSRPPLPPMAAWPNLAGLPGVPIGKRTAIALMVEKLRTTSDPKTIKIIVRDLQELADGKAGTERAQRASTKSQVDKGGATRARIAQLRDDLLNDRQRVTAKAILKAWRDSGASAPANNVLPTEDTVRAHLRALARARATVLCGTAVPHTSAPEYDNNGVHLKNEVQP